MEGDADSQVKSLEQKGTMQNEDLVKLSVTGTAGPVCEIDAAISWTGMQLKKALEQRTGISHRHQKLCLGILELEDALVLASQGVSSSNHSILLVCELPVHIYVVGSGIHYWSRPSWTGKPLCTFEVLDPKTRTWTLGPSLSSCRAVHGLTVWHGKLYVLGNTDPDVFDKGTNLLSIDMFDPHSQTWTTIASIPYRRNFKFAAGNGKLYASGGQQRNLSGPSPFSSTISVDSFDLNTCTHILLPSMIFERCDFGFEVLDDKLYVVGGVGVDDYLADGEVFDMASAAWGHLPPMPLARANFCLIAAAAKLYAFGGENDAIALAIADVFDPSAGVWLSLPSMGVPRAFVSQAVELAGKLYVLGGADSAGEVYDPIANAWTTLPPMIRHRSGFGVAVVEDSFFTIGGFEDFGNSTRCLQSAEVFNASADAWEELPSPSAVFATFRVAVLTEKPLCAS